MQRERRTATSAFICMTKAIAQRALGIVPGTGRSWAPQPPGRQKPHCEIGSSCQHLLPEPAASVHRPPATVGLLPLLEGQSPRPHPEHGSDSAFSLFLLRTVASSCLDSKSWPSALAKPLGPLSSAEVTFLMGRWAPGEQDSSVPRVPHCPGLPLLGPSVCQPQVPESFMAHRLLITLTAPAHAPLSGNSPLSTASPAGGPG
ncbi:wiskott-Aldrich syndrome protein homolog 1-like [Heterocephalus glaber]|uniref:Wiskott-Aldrich syndrome protein homolog 1-like n=1 Tax=Heterocephalus glaber TaxID=10181 RepID=A0AAX6TET9_HETGA|nr:wiskott-Aldrich syndrome protein homolog 1-like [Heterocephalus glaber]